MSPFTLADSISLVSSQLPPKHFTHFNRVILSIFYAGPVEEYYYDGFGKSIVDTVINLTGFALVGGPASQDHKKAASVLKKLNVPYMCAVPLVFQSFEEWQASELGLHPIQVCH